MIIHLPYRGPASTARRAYCGSPSRVLSGSVAEFRRMTDAGEPTCHRCLIRLLHAYLSKNEKEMAPRVNGDAIDPSDLARGERT